MLGLAVVIVALPARGQSAPPDAPMVAPGVASSPRGPLFHPDGPGAGRLRLGVGALVDVLSPRVVESEQRQIPKLTADLRLGLPAGFSLQANVAAIVIVNELGLGATFAIRAGDVSLALHDRVAFWYGFLGVSGFDAQAWGVLNYPGASIGVPWKENRFTLTGELIGVVSQRVALGDSGTTLSRKHLGTVGASVSATAETLLAGGGLFYYGVGIFWAPPNYQAWVAFSDSLARVPYPRFVGGYAFLPVPAPGPTPGSAPGSAPWIHVRPRVARRGHVRVVRPA